MKSSGGNEETPGGGIPDALPGPVAVAINGITTIFEKGTVGASPKVRLVLAVVGIVAIVVVIISALLLFSGSEKQWPVVCIVLGGFVMILLAIPTLGRMAIPNGQEEGGVESPGTHVMTPWVRVVPKLPV